jgi:hypothetical protein
VINDCIAAPKPEPREKTIKAIHYSLLVANDRDSELDANQVSKTSRFWTFPQRCTPQTEELSLIELPEGLCFELGYHVVSRNKP